MTAADPFTELAMAGVELRIEQGRLRYRAPQGALTEPLRQWLLDRKAEILAQGVEGRLRALSLAQQRLWFLHSLAPESPVYNIPHAIHTQGALDVAALQSSLGEIVRRHEVLRSRFPAVDGHPVQIVPPPQAFRMPVADLGALAGLGRFERARALALEFICLPFDLTRRPPMRALLIRLGPQEHLLVMAIHHSSFDAWSADILFRELDALYGAYSAGRPSPLPEPPIQYADYAVMQRREILSDEIRGQTDYWKRQLAGSCETVELPADRPRGEGPTFRGAQHYRFLGADLSRAAGEMSRREGVTLFMFLLAAFQALLHRCSAQRDFNIGSVMAGRSRDEIAQLLGFFINVLVIRADCSGDPSFTVLLQRVRSTVLEAFSNQEVPFDALVEELKPRRSLNRTPFFEVVFQMMQAKGWNLRLAGRSRRLLRMDTGTAKFPFSLIVVEQEEGLTGRFEYQADLFEKAAVERLALHFQTLLQSIVEQPQRRLSELPLLTGPERRLLLGWSGSGRLAKPQAGLAELFVQQAERNSHRAAAAYGQAVLSYGGLKSLSGRLAQRLRQAGAEPETLSALCMERGLEMVAAMLAVIRAGAAYLPLDPDWPAQRLELMLHESGARLFLSSSPLRLDLPQGCRTTTLEEVFQEAARMPEPLPGSFPPANAESLAYVICTSGSTGRPKGVAAVQGAIVRLVCGSDYVQIRPGDRVGQASNSSFDAATFEIWGPLLNGGLLVGLRKEHILSPQGLARAVEQYGVEILFLTTALFNRISDELPGCFAPLGQLLFGGETADPRRVRRVLGEEPPERLLHVYGPTESTTFATWMLVEAVPTGAVSVPIGGPLKGTSAHILDRRLNLAPAGGVGELCIGGWGLARCYLGDPRRTAEHFIPDAFSGPAGGRLYRSGDLARCLIDGTIRFLGRADSQVKVRGFRVEPGEVEAALCRHPLIRQAAVQAWPSPEGDMRLAAYIVLNEASGGPASRELPRQALKELRAGLLQQLPEFMVPSFFVPLQDLPLTTNGKLNRKALPAPQSRSDELQEGTAPRDPVEEELARIWCELLGVERVCLEDNFFELGGHSLLATRLVSRIRHIFELELPLGAAFLSASLGDLAATVRQAIIDEIDALSDEEAEILAGESPAASTG